MDRRTFIMLTTLSALASAAHACAGSSPTAKTATTGASFQPVGNAMSVKDPGTSLTASLSNTPIAVVRDPQGGKLSAVSRICTHSGCTIDWQNQAQKFVCPCHGAEFSASGAVLNGPAKRPLQTYAVKEEGEQVLVQG